MKQLLSCLLLFIALISCQKEECKNCILFEVSTQGDTSRTNLGEKCGDELKEIKGKDFVGADGETYVECR